MSNLNLGNSSPAPLIFSAVDVKSSYSHVVTRFLVFLDPGPKAADVASPRRILTNSLSISILPTCGFPSPPQCMTGWGSRGGVQQNLMSLMPVLSRGACVSLNSIRRTILHACSPGGTELPRSHDPSRSLPPRPCEREYKNQNDSERMAHPLSTLPAMADQLFPIRADESALVHGGSST